MIFRVVLALMAEAKAAALASVKPLDHNLMEYNRESQYSGVKQQKGWYYDTYSISFTVVFVFRASARTIPLASPI